MHPPTAHTHVSVGSLERWIRSKLPAHLHCRQCLLIGRQLGQASAPGLRGTREEIWSEGKAREKGEKTAKEEIDGKFNFVTRFKPQFKSADIFHVVLLDDLVVET